jgi:transposase
MSLEVTRLDYHGIVAGIIKDLNIIELIDEKLSSDCREEITSGEAIAGMIINGLGFTSKPLSLTPRFFEGKPLELLFRDGVTSEHFNRSKLGRVLDEIYDYGCSKLFYEISTSCCLQEKINMKFNSLDTTTISLYGEYDSCCDEQGIKVTHGFSKDHRADLKQVVQELLVSQDGGVPIMMKSWDGNANDNKIFLEMSKELIDKFKDIEVPRYLIADSKLYTAENAENLNKLNFITRIPRSNKEETLQIVKAFATNDWVKLDNENCYFAETLIHNGIYQRWIVVNSNAARNRAVKNINRLLKEEVSEINNKNKKFKKDKFLCRMDAEKQAKELCKKIKYHLPKIVISQQKEVFILQINLAKNNSLIENTIEKRSCYTIGTNYQKQNLANKM